MSTRRDEDFTAYVHTRLAWLRRVGYLLCQDWQQADDLVQTAITSLYVHWRRARTMENTDGYARTILVRAFLSEQARHRTPMMLSTCAGRWPLCRRGSGQPWCCGSTAT